MFVRILIVVLALFGGFSIYIATETPDYEIARELFIQASPEKIFPYINNSKKTNDWMPWKESDPDLHMSFSGPEEGVGSTSSWESTGKMGTGSAEVVESVTNQMVRTKLSYSKPMNMEQMAEMSLKPKAGGTLVRWSVRGKNNFIGRLFCFFMNMDKMVGSEFEKGLGKLKATVE